MWEQRAIHGQSGAGDVDGMGLDGGGGEQKAIFEQRDTSQEDSLDVEAAKYAPPPPQRPRARTAAGAALLPPSFTAAAAPVPIRARDAREGAAVALRARVGRDVWKTSP